MNEMRSFDAQVYRGYLYQKLLKSVTMHLQVTIDNVGDPLFRDTGAVRNSGRVFLLVV